MKTFQSNLTIQTLGIPFDSTDFTMTNAQTFVVQTAMQSASMDEWEDKETNNDDSSQEYEDEETKKTPVEIDPDLEDDDEPSNSTDEDPENPENTEDDVFEQYLFGEDDEQ